MRTSITSMAFYIESIKSGSFHGNGSCASHVMVLMEWRKTYSIGGNYGVKKQQ